MATSSMHKEFVVKEEKAPWFEEEFYALSRKYALPEKKRK